MAKQLFDCVACKQRSRFGHIHDYDGPLPYVVCDYCQTKNRLFRLRTFLGGPPEFVVIGIRLEGD